MLQIGSITNIISIKYIGPNTKISQILVNYIATFNQECTFELQQKLWYLFFLWL